jgi:hypothetical protein
MAVQIDEACGDSAWPGLSPAAIDQQIRQAISLCWMMLPEGRRTVEEVEGEMRRLLERALKELREDARAFPAPTARPARTRRRKSSR